MEEELTKERTALLLKIGIVGACIILIGDLLMGWGIKDTTLTGIASQLSPYLDISDTRMFWAAVMGFAGVPVAVVGHYAIYKLLKPYSRKYSMMYLIGIIGFLAFGGAGVHVSSVEAAYFYKCMTAAGTDAVIGSTVRFALYFLVPLYAILLTGWVVMVYAHIRAVTKGLSPFPRWGWIFSMPVGSILISIVVLFGNHALVNAIMVGAFSVGNIWSLAGHLAMLKRKSR